MSAFVQVLGGNSLLPRTESSQGKVGREDGQEGQVD